jgi:two-component system, chemotaxis family, protein-glutamate methylesterase/glutaminase
MITKKKIRVLIVEDSKVDQKLLAGILEKDPDFEIIGIVKNGHEAVDFVAKNKPDVVSMDITMPLMDGIEATRRIMHHTPVPVVIVSSFFNPSEVKMLLKILEAGALTILPKPQGPGHPHHVESSVKFRHTMKVMANVKVKAIKWILAPSPSQETHPEDEQPTSTPVPVSLKNSPGYKIIAIGASAGGPQVIQSILNSLPSTIPVPVMIVQHIDGTFAEGYNEWLALSSNLPVHTAFHGEKMLPGHAYLAPGDHHIGVLSPGFVALSKAPPEKGLRPAVSNLFRDVIRHYGRNAIGIILSGMGADGAAELKILHECGGYTIAQDPKTSIVNGMPGEAIRLGGVTAIMTPGEMVREIIRVVQINS